MSPPGSASTCRPVTPIHQAYNACRMFRKFRILLLLVLATVALSAWRANARLTSWEHSVHIALYPVAADDSPTTARYVAQLGADDFAEIGEWLRPTDSAAGKRHAVHAPSFEWVIAYFSLAVMSFLPESARQCTKVSITWSYSTA